MKTTAVAILVLALLSGLPAAAQSVISAQSGLINFTQGRVLLNDRPVMAIRGQFPQLKEQETLNTGNGRAELLLNPGVFLRIGEGGSVRMISGKITDSRLDLLSGSVVIEAAEVLKGNTVALRHGDATISVLKAGLYRLETEPARLRVYEGKVLVESGGRRIEVGRGKALAFDGAMATTKFNRKEADALDLWSSRRAAYLARANYSMARTLRAQSWSSPRTLGWWWDATYGVYTFIPRSGFAYSPYGFYYLNPQTYSQGYTQSGGTPSTMGSSGYSGPTASAGSPNSYGGGASGGSVPAVTQSAPPRPAASSGGGASGGATPSRN